MSLPGHGAAAYLAQRLLKTERQATCAACMFPDLVDKPVRWLLRRTPNDRIPAHTVLVCAATTGLVGWRCEAAAACGGLVGYAAHLGCDEVDAHLNPGRIYLWWPLKRYAMHVGPTGLKSSLADFRPASLAVDGALKALAALWWLAEGARSRRAQAR